jgi:hypothetical protein
LYADSFNAYVYYFTPSLCPRLTLLSVFIHNSLPLP